MDAKHIKFSIIMGHKVTYKILYERLLCVFKMTLMSM